MTKPIYLDHAASTPVDKQVLAAMQPYFSNTFYNPSATYLAAKAVRRDLEAARASIASCIGARPGEIVFTAGATEANNLALAGVKARYAEGEIIISAIEHPSVREPALALGAQEAAVSPQGLVDATAVQKLLTDKTVLISVQLVNNELGTVQPLKELAKLVASIRVLRRRQNNPLPLLLHTDAAQAGNYHDLHVSRLNIDLMSINGSKLYGPKQTGMLYVRSGVQLVPLLKGGGQEWGLRSGTEDVAGSIGLAKALQITANLRKSETQRIMQLRHYLIDKLSTLPGVTVNGSQRSSAPHIVSVSFSGQDNERLMMELDERGIMVAVGSACSASNEKPSHVLTAIGLSSALAQSTIRISLGRSTTSQQLDKLIAVLTELL